MRTSSPHAVLLTFLALLGSLLFTHAATPVLPYPEVPQAGNPRDSPYYNVLPKDIIGAARGLCAAHTQTNHWEEFSFQAPDIPSPPSPLPVPTYVAPRHFDDQAEYIAPWQSNNMGFFPLNCGLVGSFSFNNLNTSVSANTQTVCLPFGTYLLTWMTIPEDALDPRIVDTVDMWISTDVRGENHKSYKIPYDAPTKRVFAFWGEVRIDIPAPFRKGNCVHTHFEFKFGGKGPVSVPLHGEVALWDLRGQRMKPGDARAYYRGVRDVCQ